MSTYRSSLASADEALSAAPESLRARLIKYYGMIKKAYSRGDFDACGARAGKFSEVLIRILQQLLEGKYTPLGQRLNLYTEARRLEGLPSSSGAEALRVFLPRALCFLYTLRNKRGFAHAGGDLDSEQFDAVTCLAVADWCLCELIRVVHGFPIEEAQTLVNTLAFREIPDVWAVMGRKRVLKTGLTARDQTLLLLYSEVADAVLVEDLREWAEYKRLDHFKSRILAGLHKDRLIEWDRPTDTAILSPAGVQHVEAKILGLADHA